MSHRSCITPLSDNIIRKIIGIRPTAVIMQCSWRGKQHSQIARIWSHLVLQSFNNPTNTCVSLFPVETSQWSKEGNQAEEPWGWKGKFVCKFAFCANDHTLLCLHVALPERPINLKDWGTFARSAWRWPERFTSPNTGNGGEIQQTWSLKPFSCFIKAAHLPFSLQEVFTLYGWGEEGDL